MKKFIFLMLTLFSVVVSANAQIATENSNALDNIGVGITAGVSTPLDFNSVFPVNPNVGLKITKDFTPCVGIQIEGLAILNDNHFSDLKTTVKATNVGLNGVLNLSNIFWGYKGSPRTFEVSAVGGLGWLHAWNTNANNLTAKTGLDLALNLGKEKAVSVVLTPAVYWNLNKGGHVHFNKHNAQLAINLSLVYHFKTSNGTRHFKTYDVGAMMDEINRLNGALEECEKREPKVIEKIVEKVIVKEAPTTATAAVAETKTWTVPFDYGMSKLTVEGAFLLNQIGENLVVDIEGEASPEGKDSFNKKLAKKRAEVVAKFLEKRGVKVGTITTKTNAEKAAIVTVAQ